MGFLDGLKRDKGESQSHGMNDRVSSQTTDGSFDEVSYTSREPVDIESVEVHVRDVAPEIPDQSEIRPIKTY